MSFSPSVNPSLQRLPPSLLPSLSPSLPPFLPLSPLSLLPLSGSRKFFFKWFRTMKTSFTARPLQTQAPSFGFGLEKVALSQVSFGWLKIVPPSTILSVTPFELVPLSLVFLIARIWKWKRRIVVCELALVRESLRFEVTEWKKSRLLQSLPVKEYEWLGLALESWTVTEFLVLLCISDIA